MSQPSAKEILRKARQLAQIAAGLRQGEDFSITRLTVLKGLCQEQEVAARFATYLAQRTHQRVEEKAAKPGHVVMEEWSRQRQLIGRAVASMEEYLRQPTEAGRSRLRALLQECVGEQNEYRRIHGGPVRLIRNSDLLLVEYALHCVVAHEDEVPNWAYQTARHYAERYEPEHGTGLVPSSASLVEDIAAFWADVAQARLTAEEIEAVGSKEVPKMEQQDKAQSDAGSVKTGSRSKPSFTERQGQFLAFIHLYRKLHKQGPAELDMVKFFRVTPPSVHGMVVKLEQLGLITREPGVARSARVHIPEKDIPELEHVAGPPW